MGKRIVPPEEPAEIHDVPLLEALEERYLAYALSPSCIARFQTRATA